MGYKPQYLDFNNALEVARRGRSGAGMSTGAMDPGFIADIRALEGGRMPSYMLAGGGSGGYGGSGSGGYASFNYSPPKPPEPPSWLTDITRSRAEGKGVFDEQVYKDALNTLKETAGLNYQQSRDALNQNLAQGNMDPNSGPAIAGNARLLTEMSRDVTSGQRGLTQYRNDVIQNAIQNALGVGNDTYGTQMSGYGPYVGASTNAAIAGYKGQLDQLMQDKTLGQNEWAKLLDYYSGTQQQKLDYEQSQPDWADYLQLGIGGVKALMPYGLQNPMAQWQSGNPTAVGQVPTGRATQTKWMVNPRTGRPEQVPCDERGNPLWDMQ